MIRRLSIAASIAISALSLSGCVSDYAYRDGPGDYYYGQPTVDYNYYGAPYGSVGYGGYGGYGSGYYGGIGYGSGYYGGGYGYPYGYGGTTYVYPRYYGGRHRDRDRDGHGRPDRDHGPVPPDDGTVRGGEKIRGIIERRRAADGQARDDRNRGQQRYRVADPRGQRSISQPSQGLRAPADVSRPREAIQNRQLRTAPSQQMRAPQGRSAPVQRSAPATRSERGLDRGRVSER